MRQKITNSDRAKLGEMALQSTPDYEANGPHDALVDLLANLMHRCNRAGWHQEYISFDYAYLRARDHFRTEAAEEANDREGTPAAAGLEGPEVEFTFNRTTSETLNGFVIVPIPGFEAMDATAKESALSEWIDTRTPDDMMELFEEQNPYEYWEEGDRYQPVDSIDIESECPPYNMNIQL